MLKKKASLSKMLGPTAYRQVCSEVTMNWITLLRVTDLTFSCLHGNGHWDVGIYICAVPESGI